MQPASFIGTLTANRLVFLGSFRQGEAGTELHAVALAVGTQLVANRSDYWVLQFGTWATGVFTELAQVSLALGVHVTGTRIPFPDPPRIENKYILAMRAVKHGAPAPAENVSLVIETSNFERR